MPLTIKKIKCQFHFRILSFLVKHYTIKEILFDNTYNQTLEQIVTKRFQYLSNQNIKVKLATIVEDDLKASFW